jgi:DivIVA domain-containing protein
MPFAPHEIEQKKFVVALRGYQTDEVEAFLRAVAADYRAAVEAVQDLPEPADAAVLRDAREQAERIVEAAQADARQIRATAHVQANVAELRVAAQNHARELRLAAEAEAEEIRAQAAREAHELRDAAVRESEAAYAEITRQAEELRRLETSLWSRMHALEHTVVECRQALSHVSSLQPMQAASKPLQTNTLPTVDELLYRVEAASLGAETNTEVATTDL